MRSSGCRHPLALGVLVCALVLLAAAVLPRAATGQAPSPSPAPTPTPAPTTTPAPGPSPTPAPSPTGTPTPAPRATPTPTPTPRVLAVEVVGNRHIPTDQILAQVQVRPTTLLDPETVRRDVQAIGELGWFADVTARVQGVPGGVRVVYVVVENPVVIDVVVEGNTVIPTPEILQALRVPLNQVLNFRQLREGTQAVERLYESRGYVLARVADAGLTPADGGRLRVRIAEGRIEAIEFRGLTKTQPFVLRRALTLKPGDVFNVQRVNRDLQRVFELGFFENVQARPRPGSTPDAVVLEIEVQEARTGRIAFGIGYSTVQGVVGSLEVGERNWRGRGQSVTLRMERGVGLGPGTETSPRFNFSLNFREPFLDELGTGLEISLFQTSAIQREFVLGTLTSRYDLSRTGSFVEGSRPVAPDTTVFLRLRSELASIDPLPLDPNDPASPAPPPTFFNPGCLSSAGGCRTVALAATGVRDTRDNKIEPTRGSRQLLSVELGLPALGGEFAFQKYVAEYVQYFPFGGGSLLAGRVTVGLSGGDLPLQEFFVVGGATTLRGFPAGRFRGPSMGLLNVEYRTPLGGIASFLRDFTGVVFVDAGAAPLGGGEGLQVAYGVGTAFRTPLGTIRLDVAFGPEGTQTWLSLGHPF